MSWHTTVWLVIDMRGIYDDYWEYPVCAFASKDAAEECAAKRTERQGADDWDYGGAKVQAVRLVREGEPGTWDAMGLSALRRLREIGEHVAKGEPLEFLGAIYERTDE